ncbi:MAG: hypothetical protein LBQ43_05360, partial [Holosporales bacterium]|nr:hypothetical protein [Holosporales bacterium]
MLVSKVNVYTLGACCYFLGCVHVFSAGSVQNGNNSSQTEVAQKQDSNSFSKCVDRFLFLRQSLSHVNGEVTPEQLQLRDDILRMHESGTFTAQEDASALKRFLESLILSSKVTTRISRSEYAMNMLKYVMLSLG